MRSIGAPVDSSTSSRVNCQGCTGAAECNEDSSSQSVLGKRSGLVPAHWASLMNAAPERRKLAATVGSKTFSRPKRPSKRAGAAKTAGVNVTASCTDRTARFGRGGRAAEEEEATSSVVGPANSTTIIVADGTTRPSKIRCHPTCCIFRD